MILAYSLLSWSPREEIPPIMAYTGETLPERGTFFRLQVYERVATSPVELYERLGEFVLFSL